MPHKLVIVESPTKARTISRFLGSDFVVESSFGHIRDLPKSKIGVDPEHNFEPHYVIPLKSRPIVKKLKELTKKADEIILATDEDREGEAIAWHLVQALEINMPQEQKPAKKKAAAKTSEPQQKKRIERIVFHEITKRAVEQALLEPRDLDVKRVASQQARRILDRLVGYKLSPFLWKKVYRGLSAGRVQSVAVRLIVEREREIEKFKPQEYWSLIARLAKKIAAMPFDATLTKIKGETIDKFAIPDKAAMQKIVENLKDAPWRVERVEKKAITKNPPMPFTTSTLQQESFRRLGFSAKQTMRLAQQLYEGIEIGAEGQTGLITYMRTDSLNLSEDALGQASDYIKTTFGNTYALPSPRRFKTKSKGAQEAHEAIRPTDPARHPDQIKYFLDPRQFRLYNLIWRRFMATQMPQAIFDHTTAEILAQKDFTFRATGQIMKFDGFLKVYPLKITEAELPDLTPDEMLDLRELVPIQHFTEPPARFSEATLVKALEQHGIGRPSTYAPIISTIQDRGYVEKYERRYLKPTETGFLVNDILVEHFPKIVDIEFTAKMEREFDEIAEGKTQWQSVIKEFYEPFARTLEEKYEEVKKHEITETTDEMCDLCGKQMIVKLGRFGKFLACSGFPDCKKTKTIKQEPKTIGMKCPKCLEGDVIMRFTKRKKLFYGCSRYPTCDFASWTDPRLPEEKKGGG